MDTIQETVLEFEDEMKTLQFELKKQQEQIAELKWSEAGYKKRGDQYLDTLMEQEAEIGKMKQTIQQLSQQETPVKNKPAKENKTPGKLQTILQLIFFKLIGKIMFALEMAILNI